MHTYTISPELFKRSQFNDEFEDWMSGCFKSKWDRRDINREEEYEEEPVENFDPSLLKED